MFSEWYREHRVHVRTGRVPGGLCVSESGSRILRIAEGVFRTFQNITQTRVLNARPENLLFAERFKTYLPQVHQRSHRSCGHYRNDRSSERAVQRCASDMPLKGLWEVHDRTTETAQEARTRRETESAGEEATRRG